MNCRNWWFAPLYGPDFGEGMPDIVHGPDIELAFKVARRKWPDANGWRCLGLVSKKDPEMVRKSRDSGKQQIVGPIHKVTINI